MIRKSVVLTLILVSFILVASCARTTETPTKKVSPKSTIPKRVGKPQVLEFYADW